MFCRQCGKPLSETVSFCPYCGTATVLQQDSQATAQAPAVCPTSPSPQQAHSIKAGRHVASSTPRQTPTYPTGQPTPPPFSAQQAAPSPQNAQRLSSERETSNKKRPNRKAIIGIVIAIIVIAAAIVGGLLFKQNQDAIAAAHKPTTVAVALKADGYNSSGASGVPVHVSGTDLDGNTVSKDERLEGTTGDLELLRGEYNLTCEGDAIDGSGAFYARPTTVITITIDEEGAHIQGSSTSSVTITYSVVAPENVTDEQIAAVQAWMNKYGCDSTTTANLGTLAQEKRAARQAEIAEAERKAAEEKAAAEAAAAAAAAEAAKQNALASNPSTVSVGSTVQLTGTVEYIWRSKAETGMGWTGLWYILKLPSAITIKGKSVTEIQIYHGMNEMSASPWSDVKNQVVTVSGTITGDGGTVHYIRDFSMQGTTLVATY